MSKREGPCLFEAPDGYVYDFKEPKIITIKDQDGNVIEEEEHFYVKKLYLGSFDGIDNYKLVKDPKGV